MIHWQQLGVQRNGGMRSTSAMMGGRASLAKEVSAEGYFWCEICWIDATQPLSRLFE